MQVATAATARTRAFIHDLKEFLAQGNVFDLAVGLVIGASFGEIVTSFVDDIVSPLLFLFILPNALENSFFILRCPEHASHCQHDTLKEARSDGAIVVAYGNFIHHVLTFFIIATALFILLKFYLKIHNRFGRVSNAATPRECNLCFAQIDDRAVRCSHCSADIGPMENVEVPAVQLQVGSSPSGSLREPLL